jgi:hypothetical protein
MEFKGFKTKDVKFYSRSHIIYKLYEVLPTVWDTLKIRKLPKSKYVDIALKHSLSNYRVCTLADINSLGFMKSFTENQKVFFNTNGEFIVIFNTINNKPISIVCRSLKGKEFIDYSLFYTIYGLDLMADSFKYGDWVVLTEGIYDSDSFRGVYKNTLALLTSNITVMQSEVLSTISNRFVLGFDNDAGGLSGLRKSEVRLKETNPNCMVEFLSTFAKDKDLGVMEEYSNNTYEYDLRYNYYKSYMKGLMGGYSDSSLSEVEWSNP